LSAVPINSIIDVFRSSFHKAEDEMATRSTYISSLSYDCSGEHQMTDRQTILVTGATGNIGGGAAVALARRGARVVLLGRKPETLAAEADSIRVALSEEGIECQDTDIATLVVDFSDMESVRLAAAEAMDRFPMIHGLVHSAVAFVQNGPNILPSGHELMLPRT
jgi:NAD(P)-dependent dehydrogenase (short-subunit alcohol dehydrogenase family)